MRRAASPNLTAPGRDSQERDLWQKTRKRLKQVQTSTALSNENFKEITTLQTALQSGTTVEPNLRTRLGKAAEAATRYSEEALSAVKDAQEALSILIALREPEPLGANDARKKRRLDTASPAPTEREPPLVPFVPRVTTLTTSAKGSPLPGSPAPMSAINASSNVKPVQTSKPSTSTVTIGSSHTQYTVQLPLLPGRPVAFKQPKNRSGGKDSASPGEKEDYILTRVMRNLNGDKNRYEVQDADDTPGQIPATFNTTLKHIVVLADPPIQDYPIGSTVLALYPDTTSFYKARVRSNPRAQIAKQKPGSRALYKLTFEDDGDQILDVSPHMVIEWPPPVISKPS